MRVVVSVKPENKPVFCTFSLNRWCILQPVEGIKALPSAERVTAVVVSDQRWLWVGSAYGSLRLYEMVSAMVCNVDVFAWHFKLHVALLEKRGVTGFLVE